MEYRLLNELIRFDTTRRAALCSVVSWKGSVPRKDFPLMLVLDDGHIMGTIGGGSMEKTTIEQARKLLETGASSLSQYDFTNDNIHNEGGLCGGLMEIVIEPYAPGIQKFFHAVQKKLQKHKTAFVLTTVHRNPLKIERQIVTPSLSHDDQTIADLISRVDATGGAMSMTATDTIHVVEKLQSPSVLHLFGGGHVGQAVANLAHFIELDVMVYDDRAPFTSEKRFPHAVQRIHAPLGILLKEIHIAPTDLVLIATRSHQQDLQLLRVILKKPPLWVGLVSSRRKWKILSKALHEEGYNQEVIHRVHAPVGLDIQAETVPEIAVSIVGAMIQFIRSKR